MRCESYSRVSQDPQGHDQDQVLELKYLPDNDVELTLFVETRFFRTWTKSEDDAKRIIRNGNWHRVEPVRRVTA